MLDVVDRFRGIAAADYRYRSTPELQTAREELRTARDASFEQLQRINGAAAGRPLTEAQRQDHDAAERRVADAATITEAVEAALSDRAVDLNQVIPAGGGPITRDRYVDGAPLTRSQTFAGYARARGMVRDGEEDLSLRRYLRGAVTGRWDGADAERRAMSESVLAGGGFMVPTILLAEVIDLARNSARVLQAGARVVPMQNRVLDIPKWTGDPSAAWHTEGATISPTDATMSKVTLTAKALASLTVVSRELLEDASGVDDELRKAMATQFGLTVDRAALYGSGTDPEPRGIRNTSGITTLSMGANGAALSNWDWAIDAVGTIRQANEEPSATIISTRTSRALGKLKDTQGQPLRTPDYLNGVTLLDTGQVRNDLTQGTATTASEAFTADWSDLYVGVRTDLQVQVLTERYADTGQVGLLCWWRGDIVVTLPAAFVITGGIL